jgi:phosphoribosylformimino-5-aminoimidazole carboxamide ribonucleotide (ProFAR) isomerase
VLELEEQGCPRYVVTEAARRGHWRHESTHVIAAVCESVRHPVIACGGVTHLSDIHELASLTKLGLEAVVLDEPLYSGRFTFAEAMAAGEPRYDPYQWAPPRP